MTRLRQVMTGGVPLVVLLVPLVVGATALSAVSVELSSTVSAALINLIVVVGLYVFVGNTGVLSFGQVSFAAIGAYTTALLTISAFSKEILLPDLHGVLAEVELPGTLAIALSTVFAAVLGYLVAIPLMRLKGIAAGIATLSLLVIVQVVLRNWKAVSGGGGTLTGIPLDIGTGTVLAWTVGVIVTAFVFQRSRTGLRLRASREDEVAARALGINVERERRWAFALSAAMVSIAGSLYGHLVGSLTPNAFYLQLTFLTLAMLVVGGVHSLAGAVTGTVLITVLGEVLGRLESGGGLGTLQLELRPGVREMIIAALTILILVRRPDGVTRGREFTLPGLKAASR